MARHRSITFYRVCDTDGDDQYDDVELLKSFAMRQSKARFNSLTRHFPFGFRLEPIQARNVSYSNNLRLPHVDSSSYSCLRPRFQGSYTWNMLL